MSSDNSPSENTAESLPEEPVVDPQDYSPPPPENVLGEENRLAKQEPEKKSKMGKVLPLAAAGAALVAVGAVAYAKSRHGESSAHEGEEAPPELPLDLNHASAEDLMFLPHIGPVFAEKIIAARPFATVEEILRVPGIGQQYFEDIAPHLSV